MSLIRPIILLLLFFWLLPAPVSSADGLLIDDFASRISPKWRQVSFSGTTLYTAVTVDGRQALKAESRASASGLVFEKQVDPKKLSILSWSWKIEGVLERGDATAKEGDDYPARIYVVFPSFFFWQTRAINYIWANRLPKGKTVFSPYTGNSALIAVESGNEDAGRWLKEQRNVFRDFRACFGEDPPNIGAIAIMTDTDNTGESAIAYYGPIRLFGSKTGGKP